jgi:hypothetical protein
MGAGHGRAIQGACGAGWGLALASGAVRVAAVLLGLFGLLLVLVEGDQGDLDAAELVTALVLVSAATALVWAGRLGYWVGLTVAALVVVLLVVALAQRPGVVGVVVTAICALPLVLLAVPAARRSRVTRPAPSSAAVEPPQGWTRPLAGWGQVAFLVMVGGLLSVGGLMLAVTGRGAERGAGVSIALFFLACLLAAPLFAPGRRQGRLRLESLQVDNRHERGVMVPYSGLRMAMVLVATACLALAMLGFVVFAGAFADDPGASPWPVRLIGVVGVVFFGVGGFIAVRRGWCRNWRLLLFAFGGDHRGRRGAHGGPMGGDPAGPGHRGDDLCPRGPDQRTAGRHRPQRPAGDPDRTVGAAAAAVEPPPGRRHHPAHPHPGHRPATPLRGPAVLPPAPPGPG